MAIIVVILLALIIFGAKSTWKIAENLIAGIAGLDSLVFVFILFLLLFILVAPIMGLIRIIQVLINFLRQRGKRT